MKRSKSQRQEGNLGAQAERSRLAIQPAAVSVTVLMLALGGAAFAQQAPAAPAAPQAQTEAEKAAAEKAAAEKKKKEDEAKKVDTVTVTGIRRAIEAAITVKRDADGVVEAISAEDVGKLPDVSIAESIARLPGVTTQRTNNSGRAQQISIRGLSGDFSTALLNGREQVSSGDSRGVEFDQYPAELLSGAVVYKTPTASLLGQGLSGTIDLQTVRPLNASGRTIAVNYRDAKSGIGLAQQGNGDRFSIAYIDQFMDRKLGVALGYARLDDKGAEFSRFEVWGVANNVAGPGGQTGNAPGGFNAWVDKTTFKRDGFAGTVQFKPNKVWNSTLDMFYSKSDERKLTRGFQAPIGFSSAGGYDPGGNLTAGTLVGGNWVSGTFDNFKGVVRNDSQQTEITLNSFGWNNKLNLGDWTVDVDLSTGKVKRRGGVLETTAGLAGSANPSLPGETISWTGFDGSGGGVQNARYTTSRNYADRGQVGLTDVMGWGGGSSLPQAGYSKLPFVDDKISAVRGSVKRALPDGWFFSTAEVGLNYTDREKVRAYVEGRLVIPGGNPFASVAVPGSGVAGIPQLGGFQVVTWDPSGSVGSIYQVAAKLVPDVNQKDWRVNEKVTTLFGRLDMDTTLFGMPVSGNAGAQFVNSDQSSSAFSTDGGPCPNDVCVRQRVGSGKKYSDILPAANVKFDLGNDTALRFAVAKVMARPTMNDMRASLGFGVNNSPNSDFPGTTPGSAAARAPRIEGGSGNPLLEPFRANAIDLSLEKYYGNKGQLSAAVFYKDLDTYILNTTRVFDFAPFLSASSPRPPSGSTVGLLTRPENGSGGSIQGYELGASLPFSLLTPHLDGFGLFANYANTTSKVRLPSSGVRGTDLGSSTIPLPGLSKMTANLAAYYEKNGFQVRIARNFRSDFVGEVSDIFGDRQLTYVKGQAYTDAQIGYEFQRGVAKGLGVLFQVANVSKTPFVRYRGDKSNIIENSPGSQTWYLGINYKL
jgi:iron complex outermembrane receptor protein